MHRLLKETPQISPELEIVHSDGWRTEPRPWHSWLRPTLIVTIVILLAGAAVLAGNWPFTRDKVIADLEEATQGHVEIGRFHQTFFPHPGCTAEEVAFKSYGNLPDPIPITVHRLTIQGSFRGLFTKHVSVFHADGVRIIAPSAAYLSRWRQNQNNSKVVVDEFIVTQSALEFVSGAGKLPLKFDISQFVLHKPDAHGVMRFETLLHNPEPPGEVHASGYLGPWKTDNSSQTPISGLYSLGAANLGAFHGIAGTLASDGSFQGTLGQLEVRGKTSTSDFEVTDAGHKIPLLTQFQATVNTRAGDVALTSVNARLGTSRIESAGSVAQNNEGPEGKTPSVDMLVDDGRIQDFLFLFLQDQTAPMTGKFNFKGHATLPPGKGSFIEKIQLQGDFGIGAAHLTNPATQANLEQLSEKAEGEKDDAPERVLSELKGHVVLRQGTATFSNLSFSIPGAVVRLRGTYSLITRRINLHGTVFMKANLSQATSGVKSFFLKVISPFLKKNHRGGAVIPVTVTGIYPNPIYKTDPI